MYGAKATPARRPVGCFSSKIANDLREFGLLPLANKSLKSYDFSDLYFYNFFGGLFLAIEN